LNPLPPTAFVLGSSAVQQARQNGPSVGLRVNLMDLNYLFARQQIERSKALSASSPEARKIHEEMARRYEEEIEALTSPDYHFPSGPLQEFQAETRSPSANLVPNPPLQGSLER